MENDKPKGLPSFKERALLHARAIWPELYFVEEAFQTKKKRTYKLIPHKYVHLHNPTPVWVTFFKDDKNEWADVVVRRGVRTVTIDVRPLKLKYKSEDPYTVLNYYNARFIYEGWHHDDPEAEISYICNPPQRQQASA